MKHSCRYTELQPPTCLVGAFPHLFRRQIAADDKPRRLHTFYSSDPLTAVKINCNFWLTKLLLLRLVININKFINSLPGVTSDIVDIDRMDYVLRYYMTLCVSFYFE